jgi:hypothetical protein
MKSPHVILLVLIFITIISFGQPLKKTNWKLVSVDNIETGVSVMMEKKIVATLQFVSESEFTGTACEHHDGMYKAGADGSLKMKIIVGSKTPCMGVNYFEQELLAHYELANRYRLVDEKKLFIFCTDGFRLSYKKD